MPARVLFLGFDAMSASLAERWADQGWMPAFAALRQRARAFRLTNYMDSLPGSIWTDIPTGRPPSIHGHFYHPLQYVASEGQLRPLAESDFDPALYLWWDCHSAGLRCAVIDVPFLVIKSGFNGVQIRDFATHDVLFGFRAEPSELIDDWLERLGPIPIHGAMCDGFAAKIGLANLHSGLLARARMKTDLLLDLLDEDWDLFHAVYGETHCATHYDWPAPNIKGAAQDFGMLREIYAQMDDALAKVWEAAGPDCRVVVTLSHGAGPYLAGPQMLPEVLNRLGFTTGRDSKLRRRLRLALLNAAQRLPVHQRRRLRAVAGGGTGRMERIFGRNLQPFNDSVCKAVAVGNNRCGAVRFNVAGRDPYGTVPLEELATLRERLCESLFELREPNGRERIIASVDRIEDTYPEPRHPNLPDLTIRFRTDLGPIDSCMSPEVGLIHVPIQVAGYWRTGDHTTDNRCFVLSPDYSPGGSGEGSVLDIAPTVLALCGIASPAAMPGRPLAATAT